MRRRSTRSTWLLLGLMVSLAGACGRGGDNPALDMGATTTSLPPVTSTTIAGSPFATTEVSTPLADRGLLTAVRTGAHPGFIRITFEFRDALPGYRVAYTTRPVVEDGSGKEVAVAGSDVLLVHFAPASGVDLQGAKAVETYTGPRRIAVEGGGVREVVRVGDFEANLHWAIGIEGRHAFRVVPSLAPTKTVAIDVSG